MTHAKAISKAIKAARQTGEARFVVWEPDDGEIATTGYHVTTAEGLETCYAGIGDNNIVFCTEE